MATKNNQDPLLKKLDFLAMIEFAKIGADRKQVRKAMGSLDNNIYSKLRTVFKNIKK